MSEPSGHACKAKDLLLDVSPDFGRSRKSQEELKKIKSKCLREFYESQNALLDEYEKIDDILTSSLPSKILASFHQPVSQRPPRPVRRQTTSKFVSRKMSQDALGVCVTRDGEREPLLDALRTSGEEDSEGLDLAAKNRQREERNDKWGLNLNIAVNLFLLSIKAGAVALSGSISLLASFMDSALDVLSTLIIYLTARAAHPTKSISKRYPTGKRRFEPLGILLFSIFIESVTQLFNILSSKSDPEKSADLPLFVIVVMLVTIGVKGLIWVVCRKLSSSGVRALAQDAQNDVFFNALSLTFPWLGEKFNIRLLDPLGGALLSLYIIFQWLKTLEENFSNLSGRSADREEFLKVLYLVNRFKQIESISDMEVYHLGDDIVVEVDICLPPQTSLHKAHDTGEVMQGMIEALDGVARAYVHLDYSPFNPPQHHVKGKHIPSRVSSPSRSE
ncbi:Mitochondrial Fe2 transporter MMT1 and related transporters (cation diffusion facilitator superfamily) [Phaffia rhodozyma]|uniref:Mitochondrial Fe2 transporter MMT1 and related transporters (Cation diffusion facilitator superfamily) n=1 Tax=Phaffia rhodozyma TaxID=264483 RepID=A0A0F7SED9_PHARH|nr:Mitochondrial Fe2 transporter MMT1 and related transporters (cation diffusion facilitator superfamily) [Phaffia rhodozyma]